MAQKDKSIPSVGLDIGSFSVKCVEMSREGGSFQLRRATILPLPVQKTSNLADLKKVLKVIFDPYVGRPHRLRISVSGSSLLIRRIKLPVMTPAELKGAIVFEAESHIPFPVNDCILDFQILNNDADNKTMNVLLVAAKKDLIQERLRILSELNLVPELIDVDIFCLMNAFEILGDDSGQKTYGLLNIGHEVSSFSILQDKLPFVVREISMGGRQVLNALEEAKGISGEEANRMIIEKPADSKEDLKNATMRGYETLVDELKHSIDYFENESGEDLKNIWVSGGGALVEGALPFLSEELGKKVELWDNLKKMEIFGDVDHKYLAEHSYELNVVLGMVLRRLDHKA